MVGHGFNSEIAQNKSMAATFDNNLSGDSPKSQRSQQISSSLITQSNSTETPIGKKVKFRFFCVSNKNFFLGLNIRRKRTNNA